MQLSERQLRERDYYNQYSHIGFSELKVTFDSIEGIQERPWDSYWFCYLLVRQLPGPKKSKKAFDLGCGGGEHSIRLAKLGYDVVGLDISEECVKLARQKAAHYQVEGQTKFLAQVAEVLPFESESFDLIFGIDILHHVDIPKAMAECRRILKPDGLALFREPVRVPMWDVIRNLHIVRHFWPNVASFDKHITQDERKLDGRDFKAIRQVFPNMKMHRFYVLARFAKLVRSPKWTRFLQRLDHNLVKCFPPFGRLGGNVVFELRKSPSAERRTA